MFPLGESKFRIGLVVKRESVHSRVDEGICCVSFQGILSSTLFSSCTIMLTPSPPRKTSTRHSEPVIPDFRKSLLSIFSQVSPRTFKSGKRINWSQCFLSLLSPGVTPVSTWPQGEHELFSDTLKNPYQRPNLLHQYLENLLVKKQSWTYRQRSGNK